MSRTCMFRLLRSYMNGLMMLCATIYWKWMEINMLLRYVFTFGFPPGVGGGVGVDEYLGGMLQAFKGVLFAFSMCSSF